MTLATVAHEVLEDGLLVVHAVSPAVPVDATARVEDYASRRGWALKVVKAGEFDDDQYRRNPVNRCYYCKTNLYARLQQVWQGPIASGANLDDLSDYRPGLVAASERQVVHPLIEAKITKPMVRAIASSLQLDDIADLPAQPCLSSRVETGIAINADDLIFIHRIERYLTRQLGAGDIRCRITASGVRIEVPAELRALHAQAWPQIQQELQRATLAEGRTLSGVGDYQRGSAFLRTDAGP